MLQNKLGGIFNPKSVAVIGASGNREKIGYGILKNLMEGKYKGKIYPVNLKAKKILALKAYPSVLEIKGGIDLTIIAIPAQFVNAALRECGEKGVKNVIVISAGFKETGKAGAALEKEMEEIAEKFGMQIVGPNCLGLADSLHNLNASFANGMIQKGNLGFISQSGAICSAMLDWAVANKVGFSKFISIGNKAVVSEADFMEHLRTDENTGAVLAYLESIKDGKKFMKAAAQVAEAKPLIIIKPGVSKQSQKAMQSHTGALAGTDEATAAAFSQIGAVRVKNIEELFNVSEFLSRFGRLENNRVAVITNAGGPGVIATDEIEGCGLRLAVFSSKTINSLKAILPQEANIHNPVDVLGDAKEDRFKAALDILLEDKNIDAIVFILTPQRGTPISKTAKILAEAGKAAKKPIAVSFVGGKLVEEDMKKLKKGPLAVYDHFSGAIFALGKAWECEKNKKKARNYLKCLNVGMDNKDSAPISLQKKPDFIESLKLLEKYKIPVARSEVAYTSEEAVKIANSVGYPVVMKVFSKDISHKTEVEGVKVGIANDLEVKEYFDKIKNKLGGGLQGMVLQPMIKGREIILGLKRDDIFGPMLMFGSGGIYTELVKDVSFRFAPIDKDEAFQMMEEIKTFKTLAGYRQLPKMDIESIADVLVGLSNLATDYPQIKELDINPLIVQEEGRGCKAVDVRITCG